MSLSPYIMLDFVIKHASLCYSILSFNVPYYMRKDLLCITILSSIKIEIKRENDISKKSISIYTHSKK